MSTSNTYFVIYSNTSCNGMAGLRQQVMWTFDKTIVEAAAWEMNRSGESLEDMAGVELIEDADGNMKPARDLGYDEILALSIEKLGDDWCLYSTFSTDEAGAAAFIEAAEYHGLDDEACAIVENQFVISKALALAGAFFIGETPCKQLLHRSQFRLAESRTLGRSARNTKSAMPFASWMTVTG